MKNAVVDNHRERYDDAGGNGCMDTASHCDSGEVVLKVLDKLTSDGVAVVVDAVSKAAADYSSPAQRTALKAFDALS